jgi:3-hydroxyisobutyrate dehydrogenase-like beta-hydroxyacid dehydrogenase
MADSLGWIGAGRMGQAMVRRSLKGGHVVTVWPSPTCRRWRGR